MMGVKEDDEKTCLQVQCICPISLHGQLVGRRVAIQPRSNLLRSPFRPRPARRLL